MKRGFTILETIVALSIISISIAGVFSAVRVGLVASSNSKDEIQAFYLAQEAIEVLRNHRDANKLASVNSGMPVSWLAGIADSGDPCWSGTCKVDGYANTISACTGGAGSCPVLCQNTSATSYLYGYNGGSCSPPWQATKFKREVQITNIGGNEVEVVISVSWSRGAQNYNIKVKTLMLNWQ